MTDCESGTSAAPNTPWSRRNRTIWLMSCAMPQSIDATVKPIVQTMNRRLRPKRAAIQPSGDVMIAAATMYDVRIQFAWSSVVPRFPCM